MSEPLPADGSKCEGVCEHEHEGPLLHFGMLLQGSTTSMTMARVRERLDKAISSLLPELTAAGIQITTSQFRDLNKIPTMGGILLKERQQEVENVQDRKGDDSAAGVPGA